MARRLEVRVDGSQVLRCEECGVSTVPGGWLTISCNHGSYHYGVLGNSADQLIKYRVATTKRVLSLIPPASPVKGAIDWYEETDD